MPVGQLGSLNFANLVTCGHSFNSIFVNFTPSPINSHFCDFIFLYRGNNRTSFFTEFAINAIGGIYGNIFKPILSNKLDGIVFTAIITS